MNQTYTVCLYGAASDKISNHFKDEVERLGVELGKNNYSLIYGAGSTGLMGAVARGMTKINGEIIGVAPHFMHEFEDIYKDCTKTIYTESMAERKSIMEFSANAFIIAPGGIGTLDEFFQILTLKQLKRHNKPIIIFNYDNFYTSLINLMKEYVEKGFIAENIDTLYVECKTIEELIKYLDECDGKYNKDNK